MRPNVVALGLLGRDHGPGSPKHHLPCRPESNRFSSARAHSRGRVVGGRSWWMRFTALGAQRIGMVTPYLRELVARRRLHRGRRHRGRRCSQPRGLRQPGRRRGFDPDDLEKHRTASTCVTAMPWCFPPACRCGRSRRSRRSSATSGLPDSPPLRRPLGRSSAHSTSTRSPGRGSSSRPALERAPPRSLGKPRGAVRRLAH